MDSNPGIMNGCEKSESEMCSISQFEASFKPWLFVKNIARLHASSGKPICVNSDIKFKSYANGTGATSKKT